jgi:signal transduction histidine kinase
MDSLTIDDALHSIEAAADRLARLVSELLETSLMERKMLELECREVLPSTLIAGSHEKAHVLGSCYQHQVQPPCEDEKPIMVDPGKVEQVLTILIENAVKYSPAGLPIDVSFEQGESETVFRVQDRGPGIPAEDRERIFERFYLVGDTLHHSEPGIGLGLYIARNIIEAHGGWIRVEPRLGGGSSFLFMLPNPQ